jgi:hypothetical protein
MKHYSQVNNEAEIETLLELLHGFHDAMSKELHVMNRGFVESDGSMYEGQTFDVRLLLQSQWELRAVEFIFVGVTRLNISEAGPYWTGNATIRRDSKTDETEIQLASYLAGYLGNLQKRDHYGKLAGEEQTGIDALFAPIMRRIT